MSVYCILIVVSSFLFAQIAHIAARPEWMAHDPEIFFGFWGSCAELRADGQMEPQKVRKARSLAADFGYSFF